MGLEQRTSRPDKPVEQKPPRVLRVMSEVFRCLAASYGYAEAGISDQVAAAQQEIEECQQAEQVRLELSEHWQANLRLAAMEFVTQPTETTCQNLRSTVAIIDEYHVEIPAHFYPDVLAPQVEKSFEIFWFSSLEQILSKTPQEIEKRLMSLYEIAEFFDGIGLAKSVKRGVSVLSQRVRSEVPELVPALRPFKQRF